MMTPEKLQALRKEQIQRAHARIEAGEKFGFRIYKDEDKESVGDFTRERALEIKKKLDANNEVYTITETYIEDGSTYWREINSL